MLPESLMGLSGGSWSRGGKEVAAGGMPRREGEGRNTLASSFQSLAGTLTGCLWAEAGWQGSREPQESLQPHVSDKEEAGSGKGGSL